MLRKIGVIAFVFFSVFTFFWVISSLAKDKEDITIFTLKENYKASKYEPLNGIYLGAYVLQDTTINASMKKFNQLTKKNHASFFRYVGYGKPFPKVWVQDVKSVGAVPHIAFEPNNGLDKVIDDEYLRQFARDAKESGVPIFLRYASEMNGTWTQYSGKAKQYIEKWKLVHDVMEQEAPNVMMVWTVLTVPESTMKSFYPGDEYVDWVGVNIYNVIYHNNKISKKADYEDPLKLLDYVYNTFSYKKPIQISEYGATHFTTTDNKYYIDFAKEKITRFYENLPARYPRVKSVFYFDVNNLVNAPEGRKINDYSITNNQDILNTYSALVKNESYLSKIIKETPQAPVKEKLSYRGFTFELKGKTYADIEFFKNYLGLSCKINSKKAVVSDGKKSVEYKIVIKNVPKGYWNSYRKITGLPIRDIAKDFGYKFKYNPKDNTVFMYK